MKPVFNSLGSNYSFTFAMKALSQLFVREHSSSVYSQLSQIIGANYTGEISFHYKGRHAIYHILKDFKIGKGDQVALQAFTCWAVEEAIQKTGAKPVFVDVDKHSLNMSVATIKNAITTRTKAIIIQHTLGFPAQTQEITNWCHQHGILVIEDLAHAYGARDSLGDFLGARADAVALSFGRDKIIDAVSGGIGVVANSNRDNATKKLPALVTRVKDAWYPLLTYLIRSTYSYPLGKVIHFLAKKIKFLESPINGPVDYDLKLPTNHVQLALLQLNQLTTDIHHRRNLAKIYRRTCANTNQLVELNSIDTAVCLRYPVLVKNRAKLLKKFKRFNLHLSDIWYRHPVESGNMSVHSHYKLGSCPNAELLCHEIINLPTHRYINTQVAEFIGGLVKKHMKRYG